MACGGCARRKAKIKAAFLHLKGALMPALRTGPQHSSELRGATTDLGGGTTLTTRDPLHAPKARHLAGRRDK